MFITLTLGKATPVHGSPSTLKPEVTAKTVTSKVEPTAVLADQTPAPQPETPAAAVVAPVYPTDHVALMSAAGISPSDYGAVDYIVSHESGWNPNAVNASSGATGLPQALPYSKTGCAFGDAVCQLSWASTYAVSRYGSWWAAQAYWAVHSNW